MDKFWDGELFLKHEGGYKIVIRSLQHYRLRLGKISQSPELKDSAAMFGMLLQQEGVKNLPLVDKAIKMTYEFLAGEISSNQIKEQIPFFDKALMCYKSDIIKARDTGHPYYLGLIKNTREAENDLKKIEVALQRIKLFF